MSDNVEQLTLWGEIYPYYKIKQPVILLEMFAGIGSMRKALSILNVKVDEENYNAMREIGMSDSAIYHMAGDSVISTCWVSIMNPLVNEKNKHIEIVDRYVEKEIVNR